VFNYLLIELAISIALGWQLQLPAFFSLS